MEGLVSFTYCSLVIPGRNNVTSFEVLDFSPEGLECLDEEQKS
jgi:hypothetical protein